MADDAERHEVEIRQELGEAKEQFRQRFISMSGSAIRGLITLNPVYTGFAVNSYQFKLGDLDLPALAPIPSGGGLSAAAADSLKSETISGAESFLAVLNLGDVMTITNNAQYIGELDSGSSPQAPQGMTRPTLSRLRSRFGTRS